MGNLALKWMRMSVVMRVKQSLHHVCPKNAFLFAENDYILL
jgi:hypothetical protein